MKIAVCIKEVLDSRLPMQVLPGGGEIVQLGSDTITLVNPADRAALEIAIRLRQANPSCQITAFSVCEKEREGALYFALARGVDGVERITPAQQNGSNNPTLTALQLALRFSRQNFDLIFCGDETLDNSTTMVGPLLAELLDLPQVTSVGKMCGCFEDKLVLERVLDRGCRELVEVNLPALVSFTADAADPQYVSLRRQEGAHKKEIPIWSPALDSSIERSVRWPAFEKVVPPRARVKKRFTPDVKLSPAERVKIIMSGGIQAQTSNQSNAILEGDPEYLSEQLFRFLKHHELI
jgi:electron transfer flavoprotein beta subunit